MFGHHRVGWLAIVGLLSFYLNVCAAEPRIEDYINQADGVRLKAVVALPPSISNADLASIYYYVSVHTNLGSLPDAEVSTVCSHLQKADKTTLESIYHASLAAQLLGNCALGDAANLAAKLNALAKDDTSVGDLYKIGSALVALGKPIDSTKFSRLLLAAIKREESLLNTGLALQLAAKFSPPGDKLQKALEVTAQVDEVGNKFLQFEGGLSVTSAIVNGVYQYSQAIKKPVPFSAAQVTKLVNYFLSRKHVLSPKGVSDLLVTLKMFTNNKYHVPYVFSIYGGKTLSKGNTVLTVKVCNVLGGSVGPVSVIGPAFTTTAGGVFAKNIAFKQVTGDSTLYAYDFATNGKNIPAAEYTLVVNANPQKADAAVLGNVGAELSVRVLTEVELVDAEISIVDVDVGSHDFKLKYPEPVKELLEADYNQRVQLKFGLKDVSSGKDLEAHQVFLRFQNQETQQEVIFVAEKEGAVYKVDLNLNTRSGDFGNLMGDYQIELLVGDALVENSIRWAIGKIHLKLPNTAKPAKNEYAAKPEIRHMFREQEKRPPQVISSFFTLLCAAPLVLLFILWSVIGVNLNGFRLSLSGLTFHASLALVFLLYWRFFVELNMFQTLKWLSAFGVLVYLSGYSLLSAAASKKKET